MKILIPSLSLAAFIWLAYASQHRETSYSYAQIEATNNLVAEQDDWLTELETRHAK